MQFMDDRFLIPKNIGYILSISVIIYSFNAAKLMSLANNTYPKNLKSLKMFDIKTFWVVHQLLIIIFNTFTDTIQAPH